MIIFAGTYGQPFPPYIYGGSYPYALGPGGVPTINPEPPLLPLPPVRSSVFPQPPAVNNPAVTFDGLSQFPTTGVFPASPDFIGLGFNSRVPIRPAFTANFPLQPTSPVQPPIQNPVGLPAFQPQFQNPVGLPQPTSSLSFLPQSTGGPPPLVQPLGLADANGFVSGGFTRSDNSESSSSKTPQTIHPFLRSLLEQYYLTKVHSAVAETVSSMNAISWAREYWESQHYTTNFFSTSGSITTHFNFCLKLIY